MAKTTRKNVLSVTKPEYQKAISHLFDHPETRRILARVIRQGVLDALDREAGRKV